MAVIASGKEAPTPGPNSLAQPGKELLSVLTGQDRQRAESYWISG